jgi:hypothetical protein
MTPSSSKTSLFGEILRRADAALKPSTTLARMRAKIEATL